MFCETANKGPLGSDRLQIKRLIFETFLALHKHHPEMPSSGANICKKLKELTMVHALKHTKYGGITRHNNAEQDLSVTVKLGALQTHTEVQNFITHLLINGTIRQHLYM